MLLGLVWYLQFELAVRGFGGGDKEVSFVVICTLFGLLFGFGTIFGCIWRPWSHVEVVLDNVHFFWLGFDLIECFAFVVWEMSCQGGELLRICIWWFANVVCEA